MTDELMDGRLVTAPHDPELAQRTARLRALGVDLRPSPAFDKFAAKAAQITKSPIAMVNLIGEHGQYVAGLYVSSDEQNPTAQAARAGFDREQTYPLEYGFCSYVVVDREALVIDNVADYPRFAGNLIAQSDNLGVEAYLGAPLVDRTGTAVGTVCVVDAEPRPWGRPGLQTIKALAAELMEQIEGEQ
jgi:GAF domain-containing protein